MEETVEAEAEAEETGAVRTAALNDPHFLSASVSASASASPPFPSPFMVLGEELRIDRAKGLGLLAPLPLVLALLFLAALQAGGGEDSRR